MSNCKKKVNTVKAEEEAVKKLDVEELNGVAGGAINIAAPDPETGAGTDRASDVDQTISMLNGEGGSYGDRTKRRR